MKLKLIIKIIKNLILILKLFLSPAGLGFIYQKELYRNLVLKMVNTKKYFKIKVKRKFNKLKRMLFIKFEGINPSWAKYIRDFSNAFSLSTLLLILFKLGFGNPLLSPLTNILFLLILSLIIYYCKSYSYFQDLFVKLLRKILPKHIFEIRDVTLSELCKEWEGVPKKQEEYKNLMKFNYLEFFSLILFHILVFLRLLTIAEPILYSLIYSSVIYLLIFNEYIVFTYWISLIMIMSKLTFSLNTISHQNLLSKLQSFCEGNLFDYAITIKPNIKNTIIISHFILADLNPISWDLDEKKEFKNIDIIFWAILIEEFFFMTLAWECEEKGFIITTRKNIISFIFF